MSHPRRRHHAQGRRRQDAVRHRADLRDVPRFDAEGPDPHREKRAPDPEKLPRVLSGPRQEVVQRRGIAFDQRPAVGTVFQHMDPHGSAGHDTDPLRVVARLRPDDDLELLVFVQRIDGRGEHGP